MGTMRPNSQTWLNASIGLLLCLVVVNGAVAYRNLRQLREDANLVAHAHAVLEALERTVSTVTDAETGQRGFLLTGDEAYLEPYRDALSRSRRDLETLESLLVDNPRLKTRYPQLKKLIQVKLDELAASVDIQRDGDLAAVRELVLTNWGKRSMDQIRALIDEMTADERRLLAERQEADDRAYRSAVTGILVSGVAGLAGLLVMLGLLRRYIRSLAESNKEVSAQREILRATLASIGDGVIATDAHGRVTFLNSVAEELTGWTQQEAAGMLLEQVFHVVHEETRKTLENPSLRVLREGQAVGLANHSILIARDGTEWPIDDSAAPITGDAGEVIGSVLVFREISQRKQHEAALLEHTAALEAVNVRMNELLSDLRASEELFHTMADSIPQLAWMARADGHIYWYNKRWYEYTGTTLAEMEGWGWRSVLGAEELPRVTAHWKAAIATGEPWEDTFPIRRHDGAMRWHLSRAEPVRNHQGLITCWFGTNTDITERQEMEEALRDADRRKDEFLATLAHELRNPIAPISNALQIWPLVENDREEVARLRAIMEPQVRQMTRLIDDLLDVARITAGKIQLRRQPVNLSAIITSAVDVIRPKVNSCGQRLELDVAGEPLVVDGDAARLTQVVGNLLQNAAKYTDSGGLIRVVASRQDGEAIVSVQDSGVGIPQHMLARIFEVFQQGDRSLDRAHGGLGLGLTLVKRLIELHGGCVAAHSEGEGRGSRFTVRLPISSSPLSRNEPLETPSPRKRSSDLPRHRVLVVDDVHASAKTLAMMLESIGQQVAMAHDGPAAIEHVETHRPEIVFLDIAMPGMDGYEVARQLRANEETRYVVLVALTGYGNEEARQESIDAGFNHHLTKPTSIHQLTELLGALPPTERETNSASLAD